MYYVIVDNSNVWIEGKRVSAVQKGFIDSIQNAMIYKILDNAFVYDFGKLLEFAAGNDPTEIREALLYGSTPPESDSIWQMARRAGFEVHLEKRNAANKEKKIDTGIATKIMEAHYEIMKDEDTLVLVAGDKDYVPPVQTLLSKGRKIEIVFWAHGAPELLTLSGIKFINLDPWCDHLRR